MIRRPLLELAPQSAWPRQCGAEVSIENLMGMDGGSIHLGKRARSLAQSPSNRGFQPNDQLALRNLSKLYPLPEQAGSFNTHRPAARAAV
jgi:hypothetical protein